MKEKMPEYQAFSPKKEFENNKSGSEIIFSPPFFNINYAKKKLLSLSITRIAISFLFTRRHKASGNAHLFLMDN